jgi:hypothetical protein
MCWLRSAQVSCTLWRMRCSCWIQLIILAPYWLASPKMQYLREYVKKLIRDGIIEPSLPSHSSPMLLTPKPGGAYCVVFDYRTPFFFYVYLTLQVDIAGSSCAVVLNAIAWLILLSFKNGIPNNTLYRLGGCCHTIGMYYERCVCITCKSVHVLLSKTQQANLMDLANSCINSSSNHIKI